MIEPKEIKKEIRALKKLKLQCQPGSKERIDLHRKIKDLKKQLVEINISEPGKDKFIAEILELEPGFPKDLVNLNKFTEKELQKHIECIKKKRGLDR